MRLLLSLMQTTVTCSRLKMAAKTEVYQYCSFHEYVQDIRLNGSISFGNTSMPTNMFLLGVVKIRKCNIQLSFAQTISHVVAFDCNKTDVRNAVINVTFTNPTNSYCFGFGASLFPLQVNLYYCTVQGNLVNGNSYIMNTANIFNVIQSSIIAVNGSVVKTNLGNASLNYSTLNITLNSTTPVFFAGSNSVNAYFNFTNCTSYFYYNFSAAVSNVACVIPATQNLQIWYINSTLNITFNTTFAITTGGFAATSNYTTMEFNCSEIYLNYYVQSGSKNMGFIGNASATTYYFNYTNFYTNFSYNGTSTAVGIICGITPASVTYNMLNNSIYLQNTNFALFGSLASGDTLKLTNVVVNASIKCNGTTGATVTKTGTTNCT